jgi:hypothetical protein
MSCNKFVLSIDLENDAMRDQHDVAKALRGVADRLSKLVSSNFEPYSLADKIKDIKDINGNTVGQWDVKGPHDDNDE